MDAAHRKRCKRYDIPGDIHYLTFSCFRRLPLLTRDRSRNWMLEAIDRGRTRGPFDLWEYVVMPEHVHLLVLPKEDATISAILTTIKKSVSNRAIGWLKREAPRFLDQLEDV